MHQFFCHLQKRVVVISPDEDEKPKHKQPKQTGTVSMLPPYVQFVLNISDSFIQGSYAAFARMLAVSFIHLWYMFLCLNLTSDRRSNRMMLLYFNSSQQKSHTRQESSPQGYHGQSSGRYALARCVLPLGHCIKILRRKNQGTPWGLTPQTVSSSVIQERLMRKIHTLLLGVDDV